MSVGACLNTFSYRRYQNRATPMDSRSLQRSTRPFAYHSLCMFLQVTAINKHDFLAEAGFSKRRPDIKPFFWPLLKTTGSLTDHDFNEMVFIKVLIIINISITYIWFHQPKMSIIPIFAQCRSGQISHKKRADLNQLFQGAQWDSFACAQATSSITNRFSSHRPQKKEAFRLPFQGAQWDSNPRHSEPQSDALTN